jgi:hypothetical protein
VNGIATLVLIGSLTRPLVAPWKLNGMVETKARFVFLRYTTPSQLAAPPPTPSRAATPPLAALADPLAPGGASAPPALVGPVGGSAAAVQLLAPAVIAIVDVVSFGGVADLALDLWAWAAMGAPIPGDYTVVSVIGDVPLVPDMQPFMDYVVPGIADLLDFSGMTGVGTAAHTGFEGFPRAVIVIGGGTDNACDPRGFALGFTLELTVTTMLALRRLQTAVVGNAAGCTLGPSRLGAMATMQATTRGCCTCAA